MINYPAIILQKRHTQRIQSGHLWVFSNELTKQPKLAPGTLVDFISDEGRFLGRGYYNPHSLIAGRILTRSKEENIDADFFFRRFQKALQYREYIYPGDTSCRMIYSEGDYLPGLVVDRYEEALVIQIMTAGMEKCKDIIVEQLTRLVRPSFILERSDAAIRNYEGLAPTQGVLAGTPSESIDIYQDGIKLTVNVLEGQKTGFFFDHRINRQRISDWVKGKEVLDLFCGVGPWALYAANFGASHVLGIDSSSSALELARKNAASNGFTSCQFQKGDVMEILPAWIRDKKQYDVVICDPPAFAKSRSHLPAARKGYVKLNRLAMSLVKPGGVLITSSCSQLVHRDEFRDLVQEAATKSGSQLRLLRTGSQSLDHPILMSVPETEYLKCLTVQVNNMK